MKTQFSFLLLALVCPAPAFGDEADKSPVPSHRVHATGTLMPEEVVDVGPRVAGTITKLHADYNTRVQEGTVLAEMDDTIYRARADQARAGLLAAQAAQDQAQVKLRQAERDWKKVQILYTKKALSEAEYESFSHAQEMAKIGVEATKANVLLAQANLQEAQANLDATRIRAPAKGVVIDRRVNVGQTVTAALNSPSLFLIAKDLQRLQVWAIVGEKHVVRIHPGQSAHFKVDAFPKETFSAKVAQVRLNAALEKSKVNYTVVLAVDNADGKLLPYLTAEVEVLVVEGKKEQLDKKGPR